MVTLRSASATNPPPSVPSGGIQSEYSSTRWWEAYLVRYFVGFIFGCICVAVIANQTGVLARLKKFAERLPGSPEFGTIAIAVALLGIGFCYIASAPITVLHAGRYGVTWFDRQSRFFWFSWVVAAASVYAYIATWGMPPSLVSAIMLPACMMSLFGVERKLRAHSSAWIPAVLSLVSWIGLISSVALVFFGSVKGLDTPTMAWWLLSVPVVWIAVGQYVVLVRLLNDERGYFEFYEKLFVARRSANARDVRDTYTHLREHSNSVFIVVVELALLCFVIAYTQTVETKTRGALFEWQYFVFFMFVWLIPTVYMWGRANAMEHAFSVNHGRFSGP